MAKTRQVKNFQIDRNSPNVKIVPNSTENDATWNENLSQSETSIQSRQNPLVTNSSTPICQSSSYKVSIGHETVNITEIIPQRPTTLVTDGKHRLIPPNRSGANVISLCFMCFVSSSLILVAISMMHLFVKENRHVNTNPLPFYVSSSNENQTVDQFYMFSAPIMSQMTLLNNQHFFQDLAILICLIIIVLNAFSLLVFSIEIYLGCNSTNLRKNRFRWKFLFSSSTARFLAICCFYASIPALILVMCLFILLSMSFVLAIISLVILGISLVFILMTLLTYFISWKTSNTSSKLEKFSNVRSTIYYPFGVAPPLDDDFDYTKSEELSTLV